MILFFFATFIDDQSNTATGINPMKTDQQPEAPAGFLQKLDNAVSKLKNRLQREYEATYPGLRDLVRIVLDEEEANARSLSAFPHLLLPDLVEVHIARLGLKPADTQQENVPVSHRFLEMPTYQPALALCG
jgi:hypothetical protein